jgi:peptide/nickel transport system permease protein
MGKYVIQRLLLAIPTLILVSFALFGLVRLLPGSAVDILLSQNAARYQGDKARLEEELGLNEPIVSGYIHWVRNALQFDFGRSFTIRRPAGDLLAERIVPTFTMGLLAIVFSVLIGIPIGLIAAYKQDTAIDYLMRSVAILGLAVPGFWVATIVIIMSSKQFGWSPAGKYVPFSNDPLAAVQALLVPALILGMASSSALMRYTRTQMLEVLKQDYVRTAKAKGLRERLVILRHAMPNALIPVVTVIGLQIPVLVGGSVIMESIFSIPGIGSLTVSAISTRDYPVIQMVNTVFTLVVIAANLIVDLTYPLLDPRLRD